MRTKEEISEYQKQYRLKNREKLLEYGKDYYHKNKDDKKEAENERKLKDYHKNREKRLKTSRNYYNNIKDTIEYKDHKRQYQKNNRDIVNRNTKKWGERYPDRVRNSKLKAKYGITLKEYEEIYTKQEGRCLGCGTTENSKKNALGVDHCHKTGKIRGLLCDKCNFIIGLANDNIQILESLIKYLNNSK